MLKYIYFSLSFSIDNEICDKKLTEARISYAKRALKTLFNGSQKTFQVYRNKNCFLIFYIIIIRLM